MGFSRVALLPDMARSESQVQANYLRGGVGHHPAALYDAGLLALFREAGGRARKYAIPAFRLYGDFAVDLFLQLRH